MVMIVRKILSLARLRSTPGRTHTLNDNREVPFHIDLAVTDVVCGSGQAVNIRAIAHIRRADHAYGTNHLLPRAQALFALNFERRREEYTRILSQSLEQSIACLVIDAFLQDRDTIQGLLLGPIERQLAKVGMTVSVFQVLDISDNHGHFEQLAERRRQEVSHAAVAAESPDTSTPEA